MKTLALCACVALVSSLATLAVSRAASLQTTVKLDNARALVREVTYPPGTPRERSVRAMDQIIVFLDDCKYRRTDSKTGEKTTRERKAGDVIWHNKGEDAPVLENVGAKAYRTLVIGLK